MFTCVFTSNLLALLSALARIKNINPGQYVLFVAKVFWDGHWTTPKNSRKPCKLQTVLCPIISPTLETWFLVERNNNIQELLAFKILTAGPWMFSTANYVSNIRFQCTTITIFKLYTNLDKNRYRNFRTFERNTNISKVAKKNCCQLALAHGRTQKPANTKHIFRWKESWVKFRYDLVYNTNVFNTLINKFCS